jgi:hypothetical protein
MMSVPKLEKNSHQHLSNFHSFQFMAISLDLGKFRHAFLLQGEKYNTEMEDA